jgi:ribonuclease Z
MPRVVALLALVSLLAGCDRLVDRQITRNLTRVDRSILTSPDLHVVLCGTGSPLADAERAGACTAVIAGGRIYLVDVGPGSWERVDLSNLPTDAVGTILLTHFHSDHIGDFGEAVTQSWIARRAQPLDAYGPPGTAKVVDGFHQAHPQDAAYRVTQHAPNMLPPPGGTAVAHEVTVPDGAQDAVVLERDGLRITMFPVDHRPVVPAVGYRFDYHGRSVVVSGDTAPSKNLEAHAKGADILVHEALQPKMVLRAATLADGLGMTRLAKLARDIPSYHTTPAQAVAIARDAGVQHLVLTHLVPGPPNRLAKRIFLADVPNDYPGEITLGEDGMHFQLAARSQ